MITKAVEINIGLSRFNKHVETITAEVQGESLNKSVFARNYEAFETNYEILDPDILLESKEDIVK